MTVHDDKKHLAPILSGNNADSATHWGLAPSRGTIQSLDVFLTTRTYLIWRKIRPYLSVSTIVFLGIAFFFGSIPWLSLLQKLLHIWNFQIDMVGLPQLLLDEYQRLRAAALQQVIDILQLAIPVPRWLVDMLTTWVTDLVIVYLLFTISVVRGSAINRRYDRLSLVRDREDFEGQLRAAARLHNLDEEHLIKRVEGGLRPGFFPWLYFQWRACRSGLRWPRTIARNVSQWRHGKGSVHAIRVLAIITVTFLSALMGMIFYLLLSYISKT